MPTPTPTIQQRYQRVKRTTQASLVANILLSLAQMLTGWWGHSYGLLADGFHSLADAMIDSLVIITSRYAHQDADTHHPYGHGRIETVTCMLLAFLITSAGFTMLIHNARELWHPSWAPTPHQHIHNMVLWVAISSILINEGLYHYIIRVAQQLQSNVLTATACHNRSDAISSLVVVLGCLGLVFGYPLTDHIAAVIVSLIIMRMGIQLIWKSSRELIDTSADSKTLKRIAETIEQTPEVRGMHYLRTRSSNNRLLIDVHVLVDHTLSVSEGHYIAACVYHRLKQLPSVEDVTVHIDSEDDEQAMGTTYQLPPRCEIEPLLQQQWQGLEGYDEIQSITLHYLNQRISVDVELPVHTLQQHKDLDPAAWQKRYQKRCAKLPIHTVKLLWSFLEV